MSMQGPQLQDKVNIASTKHRIWPKCLAHTRKITVATTTVFFWWFFG